MKVNKPLILTSLSIAGVAATTIVTAIMAPKADEKIKIVRYNIKKKNTINVQNPETKMFEEKERKLTPADRIELVKAAAPFYAPSAFLCILTIGVILFNHKEYKKELAAMSATTCYLVANRDKLKRLTEKPEVKKVIGKVFPEKKEFKHQTIEETGNGDLLCIEGYSGRIFRSSQEAVIDAEEKLNEEYLDPECGYCCMNDFYRFLGIEESQFGWQHGWANTRDDHGKPTEEWYPNEPIEFSNELVPADAPGNQYGEPIYCIDIEDYWYPMECWMEV